MDSRKDLHLTENMLTSRNSVDEIQVFLFFDTRSTTILERFTELPFIHLHPLCNLWTFFPNVVFIPEWNVSLRSPEQSPVVKVALQPCLVCWVEVGDAVIDELEDHWEKYLCFNESTSGWISDRWKVDRTLLKSKLYRVRNSRLDAWQTNSGSREAKGLGRM